MWEDETSAATSRNAAAGNHGQRSKQGDQGNSRIAGGSKARAEAERPPTPFALQAQDLARTKPQVVTALRQLSVELQKTIAN